jgi:hypothetical protein
MASRSSSVRSLVTRPMNVTNITFMVDRLHRDCSPLQFVRELTQNAVEAIQGVPDHRGEIIWDVDWNRHTLTGTYKLAVIDTGIGMTGPDMVKYINSLSASMHEQSIEGNYGIGAKIAAVPRNRAGLVYLSWKDGVGYMTHVWYDEVAGHYGLRLIDRPDGSADYWTTIDDTVRPEPIKDHGTMVVLLGNDLDENTVQAPAAAPMPSRWILRYLNGRYYRFPEKITIKAREGWDRPRSESRHNFLRAVTGMKYWLDKNASDHGTVHMTGAKARWWILSQEQDTDAGHYPPGGHVAALYGDELYEVQTGRAAAARLQAFGVIFGYLRVVIYVEPTNGTEARLTPNTARTSLLLNDEPLPWTDWAAEFRDNMPEPLKKLVEDAGASTVGQDHRQSIRERLRQIMDLFRISRYRPVASGSVALDEHAPGLGGAPRSGGGASGGGEGRSGRSGGRSGDIYALFQAHTGPSAEAVRSALPEPKVDWVSASNGTRTPPDLEDRAAKYLADQNILLVNADFRVFTDMIDRWCGRYAHAAGARPTVTSVVEEWFEQQLVETVMGALALKGSPQWPIPELEKLWSEEALTAAVLPRYHVDVNVKRTLGAKLGSLRDQSGA